jgi:hypothetical protein
MIETTRTPWNPGRGKNGEIKKDKSLVLLHSFLNPEPRRQGRGGVHGSSSVGPEGLGRGARTLEEDVDDENRTLTNGSMCGSDTGKGKGIATFDYTHGTSSTQPSNSEADQHEEDEEDHLEPEILPPLLIATVVAPGYEQVREARRAVAGLERVGREMQRRWAIDEVSAVDEGGDGDDRDDLDA